MRRHWTSVALQLLRSCSHTAGKQMNRPPATVRAAGSILVPLLVLAPLFFLSLMAPAPCAFAVAPLPTLQSITLTPGTGLLAVGVAQHFYATGIYSDGSRSNITSTVTWTSSDVTKATVNAGLVTAVATGAATITASEGGLSGVRGSVSVTVTSATLSSITINPENGGIPILDPQGTQLFSADGNYSDGSVEDITAVATWTSSSPTIARIESFNGAMPGLATALAQGSTTITATFKGVATSFTLKVSNAAPASLTVIPNSTITLTNPIIAVGTTQLFRAVETFADGTAQEVTATAGWSSSNTHVLSIQPKGSSTPGLATGIAAGSATVTAIFQGQTVSSAVTVVAGASSNAVMLPLQDMTVSSVNYQGFVGGLYTTGLDTPSDTVPRQHTTIGLAAAGKIQPLDVNGNPSPTGKIVLLGVGMSNAFLEYGQFINQAQTDPRVNGSTVSIINGALSDAVVCFWTFAQGPATCNEHTMENEYDRVRDDDLAPNLTEAQVQVLWMKNADSSPGVPFQGNPSYLPMSALGGMPCTAVTVGTVEACRYESELGAAIRAARSRYPNLQQIFIASRTYAGYVTTALSPEPFSYEYGFSTKWLIEAQVKQETTGVIDPVAGDLNDTNGTAAWMAWGPYIWAEGGQARSDGFQWTPTDYLTGDGTHPSDQGGRRKTADMLLNFFLTSQFTAWFRP